MTVTTNARVAGVAYLLYIFAGIGSMALAGFPPARGVLVLLQPFCAITLGVTLYALTRDVDRDLAMIAMACRLIEAAPGGSGELFFAAGSAIFCWLLIRGRLIPAALAWLGFLSSGFLVLLLVAQAAGLNGGRTDWSSPLTWVAWLPTLVFELAFAIWLLAKGVRR
jgi:hypothetical protein